MSRAHLAGSRYRAGFGNTCTIALGGSARHAGASINSGSSIAAWIALWFAGLVIVRNQCAARLPT